LGYLCKDWGICTRLTGAGMLRSCKVLTAEHFAATVLWAEALSTASEWMDRVAGAFRERYGPEVSEESFAE
jgi:hypothetical protein